MANVRSARPQAKAQLKAKVQAKAQPQLPAEEASPPGAARARLELDERRAQLLALGVRFFSESPYDQVSVDAVAMWRPSGLHSAPYTSLAWPRRTATTRPSATLHTRAVASGWAVTICRPSGRHDAEKYGGPSPPSTRGSSCVGVAQRRTVRSHDALTMWRPSADHAAERTAPWWPRSSTPR